MSDNKLRKLFWAGTWNGIKFNDAAAGKMSSNTATRGVDLPLWSRHTRPDGTDADAEGWVREASYKLDGPDFYGEPGEMTENFKSVLKYRQYFSPEMTWPGKKDLKEVLADPGSGHIYGYAAVPCPAMTPQDPVVFNAANGDVCMAMSFDDWSEATTDTSDTTSTAPVTYLTVKGDNNTFHFDSDSGEIAAQQEGEAMAENEVVEETTEATEELSEASPDAAEDTETPEVTPEVTPENTESVTLSENDEVTELKATVTKGKIATAAADLNKATKLSVDLVETFSTSMLNFDDVDKDDEGNTALDRQLAFEASSRAPAVVLAETATAGKGKEDVPEVRLSTTTELQLKKSLAFLHGEKGVVINDEDKDITARFLSSLNDKPNATANEIVEAFNVASAEIYGKESD